MQARLIKDHIVFPTRSPERILAMFPQTKTGERDGVTWCAVPHSISTARVFNNIGSAIPSPVRTQYQWPGKYQPFPHQVDTVEFFTLNPRAFCLNGMGSGKSKAALWATDYLMRCGEVQKTLLIAPLSTLDPVWAHEIFETLPHRRFAMLHGSRAKRLALLEQHDIDFYIINHHGLGIIVDELAKRPDINHIIIDEIGMVYRNAKTSIWKSANTTVNKQGIVRTCWGMTGTPTPNAPTDAFAQAKLVKPENYRGPFTAFKNETMTQLSQFRWIPRRGAEDVVNRVLKPSIRFALEDCVVLPPTIYHDRTCELDAAQKHHYSTLQNEAVTMVGESAVTAVNAAVLVSKLVQAACGVMYDSAGGIQHIGFGPRLGLLEEVIEECSEKLIVFVPLTGVLDALERELKTKKHTVAVIDGRVSATQRNRIFHAFQHDATPRILLANAGTMAHGLNLTVASTIVWYAPTNSNDTYNQANARIVRPGQRNITNIVHLYATPAEKKIYTALKEKTRLQDVVLSLARGK
jgi:SNF2 family DNA or RNA helicase